MAASMLQPFELDLDFMRLDTDLKAVGIHIPSSTPQIGWKERLEWRVMIPIDTDLYLTDDSKIKVHS